MIGMRDGQLPAEAGSTDKIDAREEAAANLLNIWVAAILLAAFSVFLIWTVFYEATALTRPSPEHLGRHIATLIWAVTAFVLIVRFAANRWRKWVGGRHA